MKTSIYIFLCVMLFPFISTGQGKVKLHIGAKLGANFTKIDGKYWENGYKANLLAGAYIMVNGSKLGIQVEPLFTQTTFVAGDDFNKIYKDFYQFGKDTIMHSEFKVNYYNIPVMLNIKLLKPVWLQIGPQLSGVMNVRDADNVLKDPDAFFKGFTFSAVGGLWINLPAHLTFSARYVVGLSDVNKNKDAIENSQNINDSWKEKMLQLGIGYTFF